MKRVAIFGAYNRYPTIEDYALYYLKGLREVVDTIIYVADNADSKAYQEQLKGLADYVVLEKHGEYDFGSYKRGLALAQKLHLLDQTDELILCNDSCYGPAYPFKEMFSKMAQSKADFWGVTKNCNGVLEHLQSYFLVFRKPAFSSPIFSDFLNSVKKEDSFWDVVTNYEVGLSRALIEKGGFSFDTYIKIEKNRFNLTNLPLLLDKERCPLIKRKVFTQGGFARGFKISLLWKIEDAFIKEYMKADYKKYFKKRTIDWILRFLYQDKTTKSGKRTIKICKIPVWVSRIKK